MPSYLARILKYVQKILNTREEESLQASAPVPVKSIVHGICVVSQSLQVNAFKEQGANGSGTVSRTPGLLRNTKVIMFTPKVPHCLYKIICKVILRWLHLILILYFRTKGQKILHLPQ